MNKGILTARELAGCLHGFFYADPPCTDENCRRCAETERVILDAEQAALADPTDAEVEAAGRIIRHAYNDITESREPYETYARVALVAFLRGRRG